MGDDPLGFSDRISIHSNAGPPNTVAAQSLDGAALRIFCRYVRASQLARTLAAFSLLKEHMKQKLLIAAVAVTLSACGGGDNNNGGTSVLPPAPPPTSPGAPAPSPTPAPVPAPVPVAQTSTYEALQTATVRRISPANSRPRALRGSGSLPVFRSIRGPRTFTSKICRRHTRMNSWPAPGLQTSKLLSSTQKGPAVSNSAAFIQRAPISSRSIAAAAPQIPPSLMQCWTAHPRAAQGSGRSSIHKARMAIASS